MGLIRRRFRCRLRMMRRSFLKAGGEPLPLKDHRSHRHQTVGPNSQVTKPIIYGFLCTFQACVFRFLNKCNEHKLLSVVFAAVVADALGVRLLLERKGVDAAGAQSGMLRPCRAMEFLKTHLRNKEERANLAEVAPHQTQDLASLSEVESCSKETANPAEEAPDNSEGPLDLPAVADMAISPKGTGMVIIEVEHEVIGSFENISGYRTGSQRFEQQATSREVLVRTFGHSMEAYFTLRESFIHTNIQRMYALTSTRKAKFLISCECIYGNLDTFLQSSKNDLCVSSKKKPPMHKDQFRNNWDQLIMHFMKQIRSGLLYLYDKKICHGRLTLKDVGLSFDHKFRSDQIEHIVVKLTLPEHEDSPHDPYIVGSKDMDRQSLGQILLSLIRAHPVHNPELRFMADSLIGTANFTLNDLERTPAMWSLAAKMDCISIVAYGRLQSRNFSQLYWTRHYKHLIDPAKREFAHLGIRAPRDYDDSLGDSIIFHRHVLLHYHQFRPAAKLMFGSDKGDVIRRFQNFYASAFVDIYKAMSPEQLKQLMAGMTLG